MAALPPAAESIRNFAFVEVRKNAASTVWYDGQFHDILGDQVLVSFEGAVWPDRVVPCSSVRAQPAMPSSMKVTLSQLQLGDKVEVRVAASSQNPRGWALGRLTAVKSGCCNVSLEGTKQGAKDITVQADTLRAFSCEPPFDPTAFARKTVSVDTELHAWIKTSNGQGCLEQIRQVAGLSLVSTGRTEQGVSIDGIGASSSTSKINGEFQEVVFIGTEAAIHRGEMLFQIHVMHQRVIESFHTRRDNKLASINNVSQNTKNSAPKISFEVSPDLIGRTFGESCKHVTRIERDYGVEVRIIDSVDNNTPHTVLIFGDNDKQVANARDELELIRTEYKVDEDRVNWFVGKDNRAVQEIAQNVGLAYTRWTGKALELCGHRQNIEDARMLLDNHNEYFTVFEEMRREEDQIQQSFEALSAAAEAAGLGPSRSRGAAGRKGRGSARSAGGVGRAKGPEDDVGSSRRGRGRQNLSSSISTETKVATAVEDKRN